MGIMTLHLALTYPNHCPTSRRTNSHFVHINWAPPCGCHSLPIV